MNSGRWRGLRDMLSVHSSDTTRIAYEKTGSGPALILVDGALCYRDCHGGGKLAALLADRFTVYTYDRRGRGESGDTAPYAVQREIDDLSALVEAAGGSASLYGISSGAALALEAANRVPGVDKLALYEPPFIVDDSRDPLTPGIVPAIQQMVADGRRSAAVKAFMREVGVPGLMVTVMPAAPGWSKMKGIAHTVPYDLSIVADNQVGEPLPADRWTGVTMPTLVMVGGKSPAFFHNGTRQLADRLPEAEHRVVDGQTHMVRPRAVAPVLGAFLGAEQGVVA